MSNSFQPYWHQTYHLMQSGAVFHTGMSARLSGDQMGDGKKNESSFSAADAQNVGLRFSHMITAAVVDNFNSYLAELVQEILEEDPRAISGKMFPVKDIFAHSDIDELKRSVIQKFLSDLGYQSVDGLNEFLVSNFGISSLSHWLTKLRLRRVIQIRNIITHNRGIVNKIYLTKSRSRRDSIGNLVWAPHPIRISNYMVSLVEAVDREASSKFALPKADYSLPSND